MSLPSVGRAVTPVSSAVEISRRAPTVHAAVMTATSPSSLVVQQRCIPRFYILGAMKAGTGTLCAWLNAVPGQRLGLLCWPMRRALVVVRSTWVPRAGTHLLTWVFERKRHESRAGWRFDKCNKGAG